MPQPTPEEIAAARAAVSRKPADAELVTAPYGVTDSVGHRIPAGELVWQFFGPPRYDGPPDSRAATTRARHWACRTCAARKGWE